jgi:hypothetical protein
MCRRPLCRYVALADVPLALALARLGPHCATAQEGFCGPQYMYNDKAEKVLDNLGDHARSFDGRYRAKMCLGSKTEALSIGNDFAIVSQQITLEQCRTSLLAKCCPTRSAHCSVGPRYIPD